MNSGVVVFLVRCMVLAFAVASGFALSQTTNGGLEVTPDFLAFLIQSMGGLKGASVLGAAGIVVQLIVKALSQPFANRFFPRQSGLIKLTIISGLTFIAAPLGLMATTGMTIGAALVHSTSLTALMVFLNQLYQQAVQGEPQV